MSEVFNGYELAWEVLKEENESRLSRFKVNVARKIGHIDEALREIAKYKDEIKKIETEVLPQLRKELKEMNFIPMEASILDNGPGF